MTSNEILIDSLQIFNDFKYEFLSDGPDIFNDFI